MLCVVYAIGSSSQREFMCNKLLFHLKFIKLWATDTLYACQMNLFTQKTTKNTGYTVIRIGKLKTNITNSIYPCKTVKVFAMVGGGVCFTGFSIFYRCPFLMHMTQ